MKIDRLIFNDCIISDIEAEMSINGHGVFVKDFEFWQIRDERNKKLSAAERAIFYAQKSYSQTEAIRRIQHQVAKICNQFCDEYKAIFEKNEAIKYPAMLAFHTLLRTHFSNIQISENF